MRDEKPDRVIEGRIQAIVLPTLEQQRHRIDGHRVVIVEESDRGGTEIKSYSRPLAFYLRRAHITLKQYKAGHKLYQLRRAADLREHYTRMRFGDVGSDYSVELHHVSTKQYIEAVSSITDEAIRRLVVRVCIDEEFAGKRGNMRLLCEGLDELVTHFKR